VTTPADSPWTFAEESSPISAELVTLVHGTTFALVDRRGDLCGRHGPQGLFVGDTRICSELLLLVDGEAPEPLTVGVVGPGEAAFASRSADGATFIRRCWRVGTGATCSIELLSRSQEARSVHVELAVTSDFADLFAVKDGRAPGRVQALREVGDDELRLERADGRRGLVLGVRAGDDGDSKAEEQASEAGLAWEVHLPPRGRWRCELTLAALRDGEAIDVSTRSWVHAHGDARLQVASDVPGLAEAVARSLDDLEGLRLVDPLHPEDQVVAAGAPWFMTLFGRDSVLTSWMSLPADPELGLATARTLARLQGERTHPATEEEPGRILHEVRFGSGPSLSLTEAERYFGTADATPLFVLLVHRLWRWGAPWAEIARLLPAVRYAMRWLDGPGDPDGDGFVEYLRATPAGLVNQGWKDSWDAITFADGRLAEAPIALAEVQGYAFAAWLAAADLWEEAGDHAQAAAWRKRGEALAAAFDEAFWLEEEGWYAIALDADKQPVDALASNLGHLLWTGIVPEQRHDAVADALMGAPLRSGWGVRTLATTMARHDPLGYHTGSVWPHDTAIAIAGLRRAGRAEDAAALAADLLAAAEHMGGRLPELFAGLTPDEFPRPVPYPASCSPQAWASAAPLELVRALLGLEVDVPGGRISLDPVLPAGSRHLMVSRLRAGGSELTVQVLDGDVTVHGIPRGMTLEVS
jgi:glycogen debranching enzyme